MAHNKVIETYKDEATGETRVASWMLDRMIGLGLEGKWPSVWAREFNVSKSTLRLWRKQYPDFAEAFEIAHTAAQAWWEECGQRHIVTKTGSTFNATVWHRTLAAHVKDEWMERHETIARDGDRSDLMQKTDDELEAEIAQYEARRDALRAARESAAEARARAKARDA